MGALSKATLCLCVTLALGFQPLHAPAAPVARGARGVGARSVAGLYTAADLGAGEGRLIPLPWAEAGGVVAAPASTDCSSSWLTLVEAAGLPAADVDVPLAEMRSLHHATWYLREHAMTIQRAVQVATKAHEGQTRKSGEAFIIHPIETATILADMKMDLDTIVAGLLHDTVEDTDLTLEDVERLFGHSVASIVSGDSKASKLCDEIAALDVDSRREANHRNMLLAMGADWRVVVVKLADRLHNMRTLEHMPRHKQVLISRETIEIFVPLAHRLGISQLEYELLQHSVEYLFPQELRGLFGLELLGHWARLRCWGVLDDFLAKDQVLSEVDVTSQLSEHRSRWQRHANYWGVAFAE